MARATGMIEARELVDRWCAGFPRGATPATGSILDVLVGDLLEEERGERPEGVLVEVPAGAAPPRIQADALAAWIFGWPNPAGPVTQAAWATGMWPVKWIDRRLRTLTVEADARDAAFAGLRADLDVDWTSIAPMELISLAMGHYGPSRQEIALRIAEGALLGRAASWSSAWHYPKVGGLARDRLHAIHELAQGAERRYEAPWAALAGVSASAIGELARRAAEKGLHVQDPWSLPVRSWIPLLG